MEYFKSEVAAEGIINYTICVKTPAGIRGMRLEEDIETDLVWVSNIIPENRKVDSGIYLITKGTYVRCINIYVSPRSNKFL